MSNQYHRNLLFQCFTERTWCLVQLLCNWDPTVPVQNFKTNKTTESNLTEKRDFVIYDIKKKWWLSYITTASWVWYMGLLPDTYNCGLRMCRECWERCPRQRLQRKPLVSDPGMHHGTCVTHVPWCMTGSLTRAGGENVPGIPGACATHSFTYLARGPRNMSSERYYTLTIKELEVCWPPSLAIPWSACWL